MSFSYWQGRRGEAYSGGSYSEYQRGLREGGYGGGGGLGLIVVLLMALYLIFVALVIAAWAALASLLAALVLVATMRALRPGGIMPFGFAFRTTFYSTLATMGMSALCAGALALLLSQGIGQRTLEGLALHFQSVMTDVQERLQAQPHVSSLSMMNALVDHLLANPKVLLVFIALSWGPGFLVSGAIFAKRIGAPFKGLRGYVLAVGVAALCLAPSLLLTNLVVLKLGAYVRTTVPSETVLTTAAVAAAVALVGYALLGGLVMAILLHLVLRSSGTKESAPGFGRNYGTALLGGLVYGLTTAVALFLFPPRRCLARLDGATGHGTAAFRVRRCGPGNPGERAMDLPAPADPGRPALRRHRGGAFGSALPRVPRLPPGMCGGRRHRAAPLPSVPGPGHHRGRQRSDRAVDAACMIDNTSSARAMRSNKVHTGRTEQPLAAKDLPIKIFDVL